MFQPYSYGQGPSANLVSPGREPIPAPTPTHSGSPRKRKRHTEDQPGTDSSLSEDESPRRRHYSGTRSDGFMFQSSGAMTSRFDTLIYTEASLNSTCGRFSVFEAFRREAELIANLLAAGKMYLPDVFASLLPPAAHTSEAELTLLREANRKKLEHYVYVVLGTIHRSQEVRNTVHRAPGSVKSVLHAESLMPKLTAGDDTNQMDAMFVSVSSELLKKTSRAATTNSNLSLIGSTSLLQLQGSPQGVPSIAPFAGNTQSPSGNTSRTNPLCSICAKFHKGGPGACHMRCRKCVTGPGTLAKGHQGPCAT